MPLVLTYASRWMTGLLLASCAPSLHAQVEMSRYRAQSGTVWVEYFQPTFGFVIAGGDTLEMPLATRHDLIEMTWAAGERLQSTVHGLTLAHDRSGSREPLRTNYVVSPQGRIVSVNGKLAGSSIHHDPLLVLPEDGRLEVGRTWTDSLSRGTPGTDSSNAYLVRSYRVDRITDTGGRRVAVVEASIREQYHFSNPYPGFRRVRLSGRSEGTYWFDIHAGLLLTARESRRLRGTAERVNEDGVQDTLVAEGRSGLLVRVVSPERVVSLRRIRELPPAISYVGANGERWYQRTGFRGDTLYSVLLSPLTQRLVIGRSVYRDGQVVRHWWGETTLLGDRNIQLAAPGEGVGDRILSVPRNVAAWGIADMDMEEHLVPSLMPLLSKRERSHNVAIYRPATRAWDSVRVHATSHQWQNCFVITRASGELLQVLSAEKDGTLRYSFTPGIARYRNQGTAAQRNDLTRDSECDWRGLAAWKPRPPQR